MLDVGMNFFLRGDFSAEVVKGEGERREMAPFRGSG